MAFRERNLMDDKKNDESLTGYNDIDEFLRDCLDTMRKKGHDYRQGNDDDVLHNFRTVGETVETPMEKVWLTYFYKHYSALTTFIKEGGQRESEPIEGRIKDMIVYLLLFYRMVQESKKRAWSRVTEISQRAEAADRNFARLKKLKEENVKGIADSDPHGVNVLAVAPTPVKISVDGIELDRERIRELAGIEGAYVSPEILERSLELLKKLAERDVDLKNGAF